MQTTINQTIEQFKEAMVKDFKDKLIQAGNIQLASTITIDNFKFEFYTKDNPEPIELEKFIITIDVG